MTSEPSNRKKFVYTLISFALISSINTLSNLVVGYGTFVRHIVSSRADERVFWYLVGNINNTVLVGYTYVGELFNETRNLNDSLVWHTCEYKSYQQSIRTTVPYIREHRRTHILYIYTENKRVCELMCTHGSVADSSGIAAIVRDMEHTLAHEYIVHNGQS